MIRAGALDPPRRSLKPVSPRLFVDRRYLFSTLGLLAGDPYESFHLLQAAIKEVRQEEAGFRRFPGRRRARHTCDNKGAQTP